MTKLWTKEQREFVALHANQMTFDQFVIKFTKQWPTKTRNAIYKFFRRNDVPIVKNKQEEKLKISRYAIRCVETGDEWCSPGRAARELFITTEHLRKCIRQKRTVASLGMTFERISS